MERSSFGRLPAELRNLIYEDALSEPDRVHICTEPGLLRTCRAIRAEAELMFYATNAFTVFIHEDVLSHRLCQWLELKQGPRIRLVRSLVINCEMPSIGTNGASNSVRSDPEDSESDSHLLGFLHLMHVMTSIRMTDFTEGLARVIQFTLNGANDDESLAKIDGMSLEDQDRYRGAKFLILSLIHGERMVLDAIDASGSREHLEKLDSAVQEHRRMPLK